MGPPGSFCLKVFVCLLYAEKRLKHVKDMSFLPACVAVSDLQLESIVYGKIDIFLSNPIVVLKAISLKHMLSN